MISITDGTTDAPNEWFQLCQWWAGGQRMEEGLQTELDWHMVPKLDAEPVMGASKWDLVRVGS